MTAPLVFEGVPLGGRGSQPVNLEVPAREIQGGPVQVNLGGQ